MITENNIHRLEQIVAKYAMQDYNRANPRRKLDRTGNPIHNPYTLSPFTNEAREMLHIALNPNRTPEEEEECKAYLLRHKLMEE